MYLIDTNVISEARKQAKANRGVIAFFETLAASSELAFLSAISVGELRRGVELVRHRGDPSENFSARPIFACSSAPDRTQLTQPEEPSCLPISLLASVDAAKSAMALARPNASKPKLKPEGQIIRAMLQREGRVARQMSKTSLMPLAVLLLRRIAIRIQTVGLPPSFVHDPRGTGIIGLAHRSCRTSIRHGASMAWLAMAIASRLVSAFSPSTRTPRRSGAICEFRDPAHAIDKQIAAIALVNDLTLVTRNVDDFAGWGVKLANPFQ